MYLRYPSQPILNLGDDYNVRGRLRSDVPERERLAATDEGDDQGQCILMNRTSERDFFHERKKLGRQQEIEGTTLSSS